MPTPSTGRGFYAATARRARSKPGKSADFIVVDQDILKLTDEGKPDQVTKTRVLETWFQGKPVYVRGQ